MNTSLHDVMQAKRDQANQKLVLEQQGHQLMMQTIQTAMSMTQTLGDMQGCLKELKEAMKHLPPYDIQPVIAELKRVESSIKGIEFRLPHIEVPKAHVTVDVPEIKIPPIIIPEIKAPALPAIRMPKPEVIVRDSPSVNSPKSDKRVVKIEKTRDSYGQLTSVTEHYEDGTSRTLHGVGTDNLKMTYHD